MAAKISFSRKKTKKDISSQKDSKASDSNSNLSSKEFAYMAYYAQNCLC